MFTASNGCSDSFIASGLDIASRSNSRRQTGHCAVSCSKYSDLKATGYSSDGPGTLQTGVSTGGVLIWMSDKLQFVEKIRHNDKLKFVGHPN